MNILAFNIAQTFAKLAKEPGFGGFIAAGGWKNPPGPSGTSNSPSSCAAS